MVFPDGANIIGWLELINRPVGITWYKASLWLVFGEYTRITVLKVFVHYARI